MKKDELLRIIEEAEKAVYYKTSHCDQCLREQQKQKIVDKRMYNERTMANVIRRLVCRYCRYKNFAVDGDLEVYMHCGVLREKVNTEGECGHYSARHL